LFFLLKLLIGLIQIVLLICRNGIKRVGKDHLVLVHDLPAPFSFFHLVFVDSLYLSDASSCALLQHERAHARQWHSVDMLLLELLTIIQWFNPFAWLTRRSLKEIHEFLADEETVRGSVSPLDYQHLLLSQVFGLNAPLPVNGFKGSLTKKRILMITNNNRKRKRIVVIALLAITILTVGSLSRINLAQAPSKVSTVKPTDTKTTPVDANKKATKPTVQEKHTIKFTPPVITNVSSSENVKFTPPMVEASVPRFKGKLTERESFKAMMLYFGKNTVYPEGWDKTEGHGVVYIKFMVSETGKIENVACANEDPSLPDKLRNPFIGPPPMKTTVAFKPKGSYMREMLSGMVVSNNPELIKEAIRVVSSMPDFDPAFDMEGKAIKKEVYVSVPFNSSYISQKIGEIKSYITQNIVYPSEAKGKKGLVYVRFFLTKDGKVGNVTLVSLSEMSTEIEKNQANSSQRESDLTDNNYLQEEALKLFRRMANYTEDFKESEIVCNGRCALYFRP